MPASVVDAEGQGAELTRIVLCVGTRPEAIKLAPVYHELRRRTWAEPLLLTTNQHRDLLPPLLEFFELPVAQSLDVHNSGQSLGELTSQLVHHLDAAITDLAPEVVLVQGDTTSAMSAALAAFYNGAAVGHVEAGLRTFDPRSPFPEEMNRRIVTNLADLHFAPTAAAHQHLVAEGVDDAKTTVTGNTVVDALHWSLTKLGESVPSPRTSKRQILVTCHRRENFGEPFEQICSAIRDLAARQDVSIIFPVHPNPYVQRRAGELLGGRGNIALIDPQSYPDFIRTMMSSYLILTDSGGVQEEAPSLGIPVLVMRQSTERQEGIEAGTSLLVGTDRETIIAASTRLLDDNSHYQSVASLTNPFGDGTASSKIADRLTAEFSHEQCCPTRWSGETGSGCAAVKDGWAR